MLRKPELEFVFKATVKLGALIKVGHTPKGIRAIYPIEGGKFEGPQIKGEVMCGGWDWPIFVPDEYYEVNADYMLKTDDGTIINIINHGKFHASKGQPVAFGFTSPSFEAPLGPHDWLNDGAYIGTLEQQNNIDNELTAVIISIYKAI